VGPFTHARLNLRGGKRSGPKPQTARMIKVKCEEARRSHGAQVHRGPGDGSGVMTVATKKN
jgi:hypothetical protein